MLRNAQWHSFASHFLKIIYDSIVWALAPVHCLVFKTVVHLQLDFLFIYFC